MNEYKLKRWEVERLGITANNTQVERIPQSVGGEHVIVTLHSTDIVKLERHRNSGGHRWTDIYLDTGGFNTTTTRRRMNEVSQAFELGFRVYSKKHQLYVEHKGMIEAFNEKISL
jgi:hypothetical protein